MTKIIELIYTEDRRGRGTEEDPSRYVYQLWTKDGKLVAEDDPFAEKSSFYSLKINP